MLTHAFAGETSLCGSNAEWIVEDLYVGAGGVGGYAPFANFSTVAFSRSSAATADGAAVGPLLGDGTPFVIIDEENQTITNTSLAEDGVVVRYTGPSSSL